MDSSEWFCAMPGTGSVMPSTEEPPVVVVSAGESRATATVKHGDVVATQWLERLGGIEKRLDAFEARTAPLEADLEARLIDFIKSQLPQNDQVSEGEQAPSSKKMTVQDHSKFIVAEEGPLEAKTSRVLSNEEIEDISKQTDDYELSESVWEAAFLAWTPAAGFVGSMFLSLLIAFNIFIQVVFCSIAGSVFAVEDVSMFHSEVGEQARAWRNFEAHSTDRMNKASWISFASRVCQRDETLVLGSGQVELLDELHKYNEQLWLCGIFDVGKTGPLLAWLCLILWYLTVAREILNSFDFANVLCAIPHSGMHSRLLVDVDNMIAVEALGWPRCVALLLLVCLRLVIAIWLLFSGGIWLCLTTNVFDLILNAAALAFVLDCDELIYAAMAPPALKRSMKNVACLKHRHWRTFRGLDIKGPLILLGLIAFCAFLYQNRIHPILDRMDDVNTTMCGGELAFVVEASRNLGHAVVVPTNPRTAGVASESLLKEATIEVEDMTNEEMVRLAELPMRLQNKKAVIVGSLIDFDTELRKTFSNFLSPTCWDELHLSSNEPTVQQPYLESLRFSTGRLDAIKCADFEDFCRSHKSVGTLVRSLCSDTCLCGTLFGFMVHRRGCSVACNAKTQVELSMFPGDDTRAVSACFDQPPETFFNPSVKLMLEDYGRILGVTLPIEQIQQIGCSAFFFPHVEDIFGHEKGAWVPDALCGRVTGSNIALKNMHYQSMRWLCPVSCGCSLDLSSDCPRSCREGPYVLQSDTCALGICPEKTINNAVVMPGLSCQGLDEVFKNHTFEQHHCEAMAVAVDGLCCCSGACDGCPDAMKAHCAAAKDCFGDGFCGICGASEKCRGTDCEACIEAAPCAPCFGQE